MKGNHIFLRLLPALLCAALLAGCCVSAAAEITLSDGAGAAAELNGYIWFEESLNVFGWRETEDDSWQLLTADGTPVDDARYKRLNYYYVSSTDDYSVSAWLDNGDPLHCCGILSKDGKLAVPAKYALARQISDRWAYGINVVETSAGDQDYAFYDESAGQRKYCKIDSVDFYLRGNQVGSLNREAFGTGEVRAFGDYFAVKQLDGGWDYYNASLTKSPYTESDYASEYDTDYSGNGTVYIHCGSGQNAFTPSCTLTPDEVENAYQTDYEGNVYDLQGHVVFHYDRDKYSWLEDFHDGVAVGYASGLYGMVDITGREIIPPVYSQLGDYDRPIQDGYIYAVKDGRVGFLNANGDVTCDFVYPDTDLYANGLFLSITNLDGTYTMLSAAVGELPDTYRSVSTYGNTKVFAGQHMDKTWAIVDLNGNTLMDGLEGRQMYINKDATFALTRVEDKLYRVYPLTAAGAAPASEPSGDAPAAEAETWTCENGHTGNKGNFCSKCGAARPAAEPEQPTSCRFCGYVFDPEEEAPAFCPNCGAGQ